MKIQVESNSLKHYGVLGMKWGRRKRQSDTLNPSQSMPGTSGRNPFAQKLDGTPGKTPNIKGKRKDYGLPKQNKSGKVDPKNMSDEELQKINRRDALENAYRKIHPESKLSDGLGDAGRASDGVARGANALKTMNDNYIKNKQRQKNYEEAKTMSNKELQDKITRLNLERQYADLNPQQVSQGSQRVSNILSATGTIAGLASTGLTVASLAAKLFKK